MKVKNFFVRALSLLMAIGLLVSGFNFLPAVQAADHRDSLAVDAIGEGDFTDVFSFVDPAQPDHVILMMAVNPFLNPAEGPSARFGAELLYQFKIDSGGSPAEDKVIQIDFENPSDITGGRGPQSYDVQIGTPSVVGPRGNRRLTNGEHLCHGNAFTAAAATTGMQDQWISPSGARSGGTPSNTRGDVRCFAGVADDSFQTDVAMAIFRIGLNPNPTANAPAHTQDVFRGFTSTSFGPLRGRPLRADGTSGSDGFGGYDLTAIAVSVPKDMLRGSGIANISTNNPNDSSLVGIWGTVSRPTSETFDGFRGTQSETFEQFERMGQQLANTVWITQQPTAGNTSLTLGEVGLLRSGEANRALTTAEIKDFYNTVGPETDMQYFGRYLPDSLVYDPTDLLGLKNSIQGRATLLTAGGFAAPAVTGVPLLLPQVGLDRNTKNDLQRRLILPDYMRLNIDLAPTAVRAGAGGADNSDPILSIGKWGVQNGRRPADDVTDIYLRLARELTDVKFPDTLILPGIAGLVPGSGPQGNRHTLQCTALNVNVLQNILSGNTTANILAPCEDARIFLVLQGTDFIESNPLDVQNVANQVSNERLLEATFPYLGKANPVPGEEGTSEFPAQK